MRAGGAPPYLGPWEAASQPWSRGGVLSREGHPGMQRPLVLSSRWDPRNGEKPQLEQVHLEVDVVRGAMPRRADGKEISEYP